ncbi:hypothetical protein FOMG_17138 [Fusarium oxysporum f. sp. melonis 26406]|uniref:Uncharacterized protein n=1 Tax=Fusarium oxysporum f. sp. melonis 26406 TaxID=1089452 RepID=W9Z4H0_FUSOX|nr:hypothetical protein FOMG_17138 [Fusarium oxysporum f. sp. melonis 26406]
MYYSEIFSIGATRYKVVIGPGTTRSWSAVGPIFVGPALISC